jgi:hypothetical protein
MRRALAAFLILSLLGGQVGMLGALLGRHHARQQVQNKIAEAPESPERMKDIEHLAFTRDELQSQSSLSWIEEHEFRYQGNLYDIVADEWRGDVWHVWVYHDREEEQYLEALAEALNTPLFEGDSVPVTQRLVGYRPLALVPSALGLPPPPLLRSQSFTRVAAVGHEAPYLEVPHPPPWA